MLLPRAKSAFTLLELLIVIGIIVILVGLLLPLALKAKRQAAQVACLSNLRQLGAAFLAYAVENDSRFPAPASALQPQDEDWVHWQPDRNPRQSRLWAHLGGNLDVLKCPLGIVRQNPGPHPPYPFSYDVNTKITGIVPPIVGPMPLRKPRRLLQLTHPERLILALEEDSTTISDGAWYADTNKFWMNEKMIFPSSRHDRDGREYSGVKYHVLERRSNFVFVDGHCEFMNRRAARDPRRYEPGYEGPGFDVLPQE